MFFVVVPLRGRTDQGKAGRDAGPAPHHALSYLTIMSGKVAAYVIICMVQFVLIMWMGKVALPLLGTPALDVGSSPAALILIAVAASLAASGYGILLGTVARTYGRLDLRRRVCRDCRSPGRGHGACLCNAENYADPGGLFPAFMGPERISHRFRPGRGRKVESSLKSCRCFFSFFAAILTAWFYMFRRGRLRIY